MMEAFQEFISFFRLTEPNVRVVFWGSLILCASSGLVGTFTFLRKRSLIGDVISHSVLPGICLAFLIGNEKNLIVLITGASITGWISTYLIDVITAKSKIKTDTAIALVLSVFFGAGILLLTKIQHSGYGSQSGLDSFIFGSAAAMNFSDVKLFGIFGSLMISIVLIFYRGFLLISFDEDYAGAIGFPIRFLKFLLSVITVITVAMGVQSVGVVLMSALLITPAATARFWTHRVPLLAGLAMVFAGVSGILGSAISYTKAGMPTGPWIVVVVSFFAFFSVAFGSQKGIFPKWIRRRVNNKRILGENILKVFYKLSEGTESGYSLQELISSTPVKEADLMNGLRILQKNDLIGKANDKWFLSESGFREAKSVVRKHRLWELYLSKYMNLKADHVHDDAEGIEHVITAEIEKELEKLLDYPTVDPHDSEIPYE